MYQMAHSLCCSRRTSDLGWLQRLLCGNQLLRLFVYVLDVYARTAAEVWRFSASFFGTLECTLVFVRGKQQSALYCFGAAARGVTHPTPGHVSLPALHVGLMQSQWVGLPMMKVKKHLRHESFCSPLSAHSAAEAADHM